MFDDYFCNVTVWSSEEVIEEMRRAYYEELEKQAEALWNENIQNMKNEMLVAEIA